jgi:pSer/pThr/pTyr-binding forkhead associated (FHA) protein
MHGARPRFVLVYQDRRIPLPDGEFVIGRSLGCHIRLNAETVSRQHLKLVVQSGRLVAENLSATTGTKLNGVRMLGTRSLDNGDELVLGPRRLRIEVEDVTSVPDLDVTGDDDLDDGLDEVTLTDMSDRFVSRVGFEAVPIPFHTCPQCRERVAFGLGECTKCGYAWSADHPSAVTSRITMPSMVRDPVPTPATVPVVYSSEELAIDALVDQLDPEGVFVPSPLLDPVGTSCELTLLPDGIFAMTVPGTVTSVRSQAAAAGPAGMQVTFGELPTAARTWLDRWLAARRGA